MRENIPIISQFHFDSLYITFFHKINGPKCFQKSICISTENLNHCLYSCKGKMDFYLPEFPAGARFLVGPNLALMYTNTAKAAEKTIADVNN